MRLQDFMSRDVETITSRESVDAAYQKMKQNQIHHLVVMEGNTVAGILSMHDLANLDQRERQGRMTGDLMSRHITTVGPDTTVREAANIMRGRVIDCLPVLKDNKLVGIVTTTDLLNLLGQGIERITPDTPRRTIAHEPPTQKPVSRR